MVKDNSIPVKPLTLADVPQLSRTRLILLLLNAIGFGFSVATAYTILVGGEDEICQEARSKLDSAVSLMAFYGFGFMVTYSCDIHGLRVYVGLAVSLLILAGLTLLCLVFPTHVGVCDMRNFAIRVIVFFDVMVFVVKYAVKLMLLVDANQHLISNTI